MCSETHLGIQWDATRNALPVVTVVKSSESCWSTPSHCCNVLLWPGVLQRLPACEVCPYKSYIDAGQQAVPTAAATDEAAGAVVTSNGTE